MTSMNFSNDRPSAIHSPMTSWNDNAAPSAPNMKRSSAPIHGSGPSVARPYDSNKVNVTNVNHYGPSYFGNNNISYDPRSRFKKTSRRSAKRQRPSSRRRNYRKERLVRSRNPSSSGPVSMSESEDNTSFRRRRGDVDSDDAVSFDLNVDRPTRFRLETERKAMDPDLTPLDDDSSSVDSGSGLGLGDDDEDDAMPPSNRWHLPLTDDDAIISNMDSVDEMSVSRSLQRERKKQRVDSGSRSLSTSDLVPNPKAKGSAFDGAQSECVAMTPRHSEKEEEKERGAECLECVARKSEIGYLRGVHVAGLGMAKLMALESELLTALSRVQRAMANQYENEKLCIVCKRFEKDTVFRPCSHISTCSECSKMLQKCPLCQSAVDDKFKVFQ